MSSKEDLKRLLNTETEKLSKEDIHDYEKIMDKANELNIVGEKSKSEAWNDVLNKIEVKEERTSPSYFRWSYGIAASVLLIVSVYFIYTAQNLTTVKTSYGEISKVNLPDGSNVTLNAGSFLKYDTKGWGNNRSVRLAGEAFFEVAEGKKFVVHTDLGEVKVVGTKFNVHQREGIFKVSCIKGSVEVSYNKQRTVLKEGEQTEVILKKLVKENIAVIDHSNGWIRGEFYYENTDLNIVLNELERQFGVIINRSTKTDGRSYSGSFKKTKIEEALKLVLDPMSLNYHIDKSNTQVTIDE